MTSLLLRWSEWRTRSFGSNDLFRSDSGGYYGTVEVPEGFLLMAGNERFVAGVHRDEMDRESVRVLRIRLPRR